MRMLLDTLETSDEEIDSACDDEIDYKIYSFHESDDKFVERNKIFVLCR